MKFVSVFTVHPSSSRIFCCALKGWLEFSIWEGAISEHPGAGHPLATGICGIFLPCLPLLLFLASSAPWVGGRRSPLSALLTPWCRAQAAPGKVTSAELYLAAGVITHLNSHSVLAEMIFSPNDVFPLLEQPRTSPGRGHLTLRTYVPTAKRRRCCYRGCRTRASL